MQFIAVLFVDVIYIS